ncbi:MAG: hypothetical protein H0V33_01605 [Acidimicrobiia bacterium]|jgi:hypothetical protein|nr:hypothetical protein [Acidimicrobiia bacterium]
MGYGGKFVEQDQARRLRAEGWTLAEIVAELGMSKSSASIWCRAVEVDVATLDERRRARWEAASHPSRKRPSRLQLEKEAQIVRLRDEGRASVGAMSERDLLIAGTMLSSGEGGKTDGSVNLAKQ